MAEIALLVVDVQRDFWQEAASYPFLAGFPANLAALLAAARERGWLVVHTQAWFRPDRSDWMLFYRPAGRGQVPCIAGTAGAEFEPFAAPLPKESVIRKQTFDGFAGTDLAERLAAQGVRIVLLAGLETSVCVLFTATSAYLRRFVPFVVADACGDTPERHEATLRLYDRLCFQTVTTAEVLADPGSISRHAAPFLE